MRFTLLLSAAVLLFPAVSSAQIRAEHIDCVKPDKACAQQFDSGLYYALPRTAVVVAAPVLKNTYKPGIYCELANRFLADVPADPIACTKQPPQKPSPKCKDDDKGTHSVASNGFVREACVDYSFSDAPTISVAGRPDPGQVYRLDFSGWGRDKDFNLNLGQDGIINKLHAQVVDRRGEIIFGFLNAAASIVKGSFSNLLVQRNEGATPADPCDGAKNAPLCQAAKGDFTTLQNLVSDNAVFSATTNFPPSSDAYLALVKARQDRINDLLSRFIGTKESKVDYDGAIEALPKGATTAPESIAAELFGVSVSGACAGPNPSSQFSLRYLSAAPTTLCPEDAKIIQLKLTSRVPPNELSIGGIVTLATVASKKQGLAYRIPAPYTASILAGSDEVVEQDTSIAQFGSVAHLPESLGGDATIDFTLDPATGALLQIALNGKPKIITDLPGQLSTLGSGALDALAAFNKAHTDAATPDPVDKATAARKLAQEQLRLQLIQQCISNPDRPECATLVVQP